jgi:hypothetical protein
MIDRDLRLDKIRNKTNHEDIGNLIVLKLKIKYEIENLKIDVKLTSRS